MLGLLADVLDEIGLILIRALRSTLLRLGALAGSEASSDGCYAAVVGAIASASVNRCITDPGYFFA